MTQVDRQNNTAEWHRCTQFPLRTAVLRVAKVVDRRARCLDASAIRVRRSKGSEQVKCSRQFSTHTPVDTFASDSSCAVHCR